MHRLFVALRPSAHQRAALLAPACGVPGARWQDDAQLHLTLRFVGEVDRHRAEDIGAALGAVAGSSFPLHLEGSGSFGRTGREHSLWVGARADPALAALKRSVDRALVRVGVLADTRAFHPHVTLARLPTRAGPIEPWLARTAGFRSAAAPIEAFTLFESELGNAGAQYNAIARYALVDRG